MTTKPDYEIVDTVKSFKASPIGDGIIDTLELIFDQEPPDVGTGSDWEDRWRQMYADEGDKVEDALWRTIPGGLYDQILRAMLTRKASLLKVTHKGTEPI